PHDVKSPSFSNTPRIEQLIKDGKLFLSLDDAIALALENNLDLAIARYNLDIADTDILRAKAGAGILGVACGLVTCTPGEGHGGPAIPQFDPSLSGTLEIEHAVFPLSNTVTTGVPVLQQNTGTANFSYNQGFAPGTLMSVGFNNSRQTTNSRGNAVNPNLNSSF